MPYSWLRPNKNEFSQIYSKFTIRDEESEEEMQLVIQDLEENRYEEVLKIMQDKHIREEPMYSSKGCRDCEVSFSEMTENWRNMLNQNVSLVCYQEGDDSKKIVAVNVLGIVTESEFDAPHKVN